MSVAVRAGQGYRLTVMARHGIACGLSFMVALATVSTGAQQSGPVPAPINLAENSVLISDFNDCPTEPGAVAVAPGRVFRVRDLSDAGWEFGPAAAGLTLNNPLALALDSSGRLHVADVDNRRIVRMDDVAGTNWIAFSGVGENVLSNPPTFKTCNLSNAGVHSIALDSAGRIYIGTANPERIVRIDDMNGTGWTAFQLPPGESVAPRQIAIDSQDRLYITVRHRIIRVDNMQGDGLVTYGSFGNGVGQFNEPSNVTFDADGRLYITDESNHRVVRIDDMTGAGWTTFGSYGSGDRQLSIPHGIQVDSLGRIHIQDNGNLRTARINTLAGDGWVTYGNRELQGRGFETHASKGLLVLGQGPTLSYPSILPHVKAGGDYRTSIIGISAVRTSTNVDVSFKKRDPVKCGQPGTACEAPFPVTVAAVPSSTFNRGVAPMGTFRLDATSADSLTTGYARFLASDELSAVALVQTVIGATVTGMAGLTFSSPTDHFTIYVDNANNARTAYTIVNALPEGAGLGAGGGMAGLTATLRNQAGQTLESTFLNTFPGEPVTEFASDRFPVNAPAGFQGTIEFSSGESGAKVQVAALRYDNAAQDVFTTIPVSTYVPDPSAVFDHVFIPVNRTTSLYFPYVSDGGTYRTDFMLLNAGDAATTATLEFFAEDGAPLSLAIGGVERTSQSVALPARGAARVVTDGSASAATRGWARLTAPVGGIDGSAIVQTVGAGRITSEAGVSPSPPAPHFSSYVETNASTQSALAIGNPNTAAASLTFYLRDTAGQIHARAARTLAAFGQMMPLVTDLFPSVTTFEGTLEVETGGPALAAVGVRRDNPGATVFTTTPVVAVHTPTMNALPIMSLGPRELRFGAVLSAGAFVSQTAAQSATVLQAGSGEVAWTLTPSQPWIQVSQSSGAGATAVTVSVMPVAGMSAGTLTGTVAATFTGAANTVGTLEVTLTILQPGTVTPPVGAFETPANGLTGISGSIAVTGWALDDLEVTRVRILRDPVAGEGSSLMFIANATFVEGARPDLIPVFPTTPRNTRGGWGYLLLTNFLPNQGNGTFTLHAYADDIEGHSVWLGSKTITVDNANATKPFGAIDTPGQGETIGGTSYLNWGWVLAPARRCRPSPCPRRADRRGVRRGERIGDRIGTRSFGTRWIGPRRNGGRQRLFRRVARRGGRGRAGRYPADPRAARVRRAYAAARDPRGRHRPLCDPRRGAGPLRDRRP
jgi:sugar lactone lactonase YvrE